MTIQIYKGRLLALEGAVKYSDKPKEFNLWDVGKLGLVFLIVLLASPFFFVLSIIWLLFSLKRKKANEESSL